MEYSYILFFTRMGSSSDSLRKIFNWCLTVSLVETKPALFRLVETGMSLVQTYSDFSEWLRLGREHLNKG